ncbi:hypothetical protein AB0I81_45820 [Nonomuraea sp. NPDC050404]|uniref:hypothetical protein n=1 Tax=Nonomuraea sp. NPDC050404 TaxID=3155783 RepID=UPI0033D5C1CD
MSDKPTVVLHWEPSPYAAGSLPLDGISYGYAGNIRAFALFAKGKKVALRCYLPMSNGKTLKDEEFADKPRAKRRADAIAESFLAELFTLRVTEQRAS